MATTPVDVALTLLNTDASDVYSITYNPTTLAYQVVRLRRVTTGKDAYAHTYKQVPFASSHFTLAAALSDAIKLKASGYGDRQFEFVDSLASLRR